MTHFSVNSKTKGAFFTAPFNQETDVNALIATRLHDLMDDPTSSLGLSGGVEGAFAIAESARRGAASAVGADRTGGCGVADGTRAADAAPSGCCLAAPWATSGRAPHRRGRENDCAAARTASR